MDVPVWAWIAFLGFVAAMLAVDLYAHRTAHEISAREAARWSAWWVALGLGFAVVLWLWQGGQAAGEYTAAYLVEKSLSVDNLFVFALIFGYFRVPAAYQHRVLFYGVLGALVMRFAFIAAGVALLETFHVVIYAFGAFLVWTAVKMARDSGEIDMDPGQSRAVRLLRRLIPVADSYDGQRFWIRRQGAWLATPLLVVLVAVEAADLVFAVDSIPAVLAISDETFVVYTSNAFAILGLRALYFLLAGMMARFHHLGTGLAVVLGFIGVKMTLSDVYAPPIWASLAVIAVVLTVSVVASLRRPRSPHASGTQAPAGLAPAAKSPG